VTIWDFEMASETKVDVKTPAGACMRAVQAGGAGRGRRHHAHRHHGSRPQFYGMAARLPMPLRSSAAEHLYRSGRQPLFDHLPNSQDQNDRPKLLESAAISPCRRKATTAAPGSIISAALRT